ncbi:signal peptidase I [Candidatus Acetothermia bacterium]|jgi:signal peptidase I|nr:signal peptidase I [Candidatus Acetothermia bacterium]MCI2427190.1 signal peptidase I [Candidatus Acetothermia bacterium]MCI2428016.1 signal peptidase I [Candidatus Acetothermia bacterium]
MDTIIRRKNKKPALILRIAERYGWKPGRIMKEVLEWVEVLIVAGALAAFLMVFVVVRMTVPTGSMIPTIEPGDSFFVNILSYHFRDPQPGDVIVFWHPYELQVYNVRAGSPAAHANLPAGKRILSLNHEPVSSIARAETLLAGLADGTRILLRIANAPPVDLGIKEDGIDSFDDLGIELHERRTRFVKRLIATGGQTVQIKEGAIYVDGARLTGEQFDRYYWMGDPRMRYGRYPTLVPESKFFVLGDNSRDSLDSRFWGFIDRANIIGVPLVRVWPLPRVGPIR